MLQVVVTFAVVAAAASLNTIYSNESSIQKAQWEVFVLSLRGICPNETLIF
jgi:hypothetical protein